MQLWIQAFDLLDILAGQFQRRNLPPSEHGQKLDRGHYRETVHCADLTTGGSITRGS